ncbi:MAG: ABC transporter permease, partial [Gammaproteobacteria bacterium]|nr:ABC transporter permease [Gammaproteobacteria bacterium]
MLTYTLKRLLQGVVTVWFIATVTFFAMHALPGNPLESEKGMSETIRANLDKKFGLDKPEYVQYFTYMFNMV